MAEGAPEEPPPGAAAMRWLPPDGPDRTRSLDLMRALERLGLDPAAEVLALHRSFVSAAQEAKRGTQEREAPGISLEPLAAVFAPCLWPHRPKRYPGELFSSWLWRAARAAGASPRRFAAEVLGGVRADPDRTTRAATVRRLASLTGQRASALQSGLLRADVGEDDIPQGASLAMLLQHGDFLLRRPAAGGTEGGPPLQYCPDCLADDPEPWFRRGWRFAHEAVCPVHELTLHEACPACGGAVVPLASSETAGPARCHRCGADLAQAPRLWVPLAAARQRTLHALLGYLARHAKGAARARHLEGLAAAGLAGRAVPGGRTRADIVANLTPRALARWLGPAATERDHRALGLLARGWTLGEVMGVEGSLPDPDRKPRPRRPRRPLNRDGPGAG